MHYYNFHIGDYKSHTHHLTPIEDLAYRRLLDHYYLHEAPIKQRDIARQIGLRDYEQEVLSVLDEFFISIESGYINPRADEEIAKYKELSLAGKKGAEKRWAKEENSPPIATPLAGHSPPNATPIATITQEPITSNTYILPYKAKPEVLACPHEEILKLWKKHLPHLTQPRSWEANRRALLRQRWVQASRPSTYSKNGYTTVLEGLAWWDEFLAYISGETKLPNGFEGKDRTWRPDLEWILNANNFQKIIDGKYNK